MKVSSAVAAAASDGPAAGLATAFSSASAFRANASDARISASIRVIAASSVSAMCGGCRTWICRTPLEARTASSSPWHLSFTPIRTTASSLKIS
jgi:hypothetical protein